MRNSLLAASAVALVLSTGAGFAQTDTTQTPEAGAATETPMEKPMDQAGGQAGTGTAGTTQTAATITCREITAMDTAMVPGVLHFIAGYGEGARQGGMQGGTPSASATGDGTTSTDTAAAAANTTGQSNTNDTSPADVSALEGTNAAGPATDEMTGATAGAAGQAGATPRVEVIQGYFEIPVEQTLVACEAEPDATAASVVERQRMGGAGTSAQ